MMNKREQIMIRTGPIREGDDINLAVDSYIIEDNESNYNSHAVKANMKAYL